MTKLYSEQVRRRIAREYADGASSVQLARDYFVTRQTVMNYVREFGAWRPPIMGRPRKAKGAGQL